VSQQLISHHNMTLLTIATRMYSLIETNTCTEVEKKI
jgi:hypothetical protein